MPNDIEVLWKVVEFLILGLGSATLGYILRLSGQLQKYQAKTSAQSELMNLKMNTLQKQVERLETAVGAVQGPLEDQIAIKAALRSHDLRLRDIEGMLIIIGNRVGVPTERLRRNHERGGAE